MRTFGPRGSAGALPHSVFRVVVGGALGFATLVAVGFTLGGGTKVPPLIAASPWRVPGNAIADSESTA